MGLLKRIFGICDTRLPADSGCWKFSGSTVEIDLSRAPELEKSGSAIRLEGGGLPERILVLHGNDGSFHAIKNRCTHMWRRIDPVAGESLIRCCSVSKSTFDYEGDVVSGPAKKPLRVFPVKTEDSKLMILLE